MAAIGTPAPNFGIGYCPPHSVIELVVPTKWLGARVWGRTGCDFTKSGPPYCETGDCWKEDCSSEPQLAGVPPATLAEMTLGGTTNYDYYDISNVDGFNLPMQMVPVDGTYEKRDSADLGPYYVDYYCRSTGCFADLNALCPPELQVKNDMGEVVACNSACNATREDKYCCIGEYQAGPPACPPQEPYYSLFKDACPDAYAYAYDDRASTFICDFNGEPDYKIIFGWEDVSNLPPEIVFNSPSDGQAFETAGQITINVHIEDLDGQIDEFEFFINGESLDGTQSGDEGDFTKLWTPPASGTYTISVTAMDNEGLRDTSLITISIGECIPVYACTLTVKGSDGNEIESPFAVSFDYDFTVEVTDDTVPVGVNTRVVTAENSRTGATKEITLARQGKSDLFVSSSVNTQDAAIRMDWGDTLRLTYTDPDDQSDSQERYLYIPYELFACRMTIKDSDQIEIGTPFEISMGAEFFVEVIDDRTPSGENTGTVTAVNGRTGNSKTITIVRQAGSDLSASVAVDTRDAELQLDYGDTLRLTYTDPDDGSDTQERYLYIPYEPFACQMVIKGSDGNEITDPFEISSGAGFFIEVIDDRTPSGENTRTVTAVNTGTGGGRVITLNRQGNSDLFVSGTVNTQDADIRMSYGDTLLLTYTDPDDESDSQTKFIHIFPEIRIISAVAYDFDNDQTPDSISIIISDEFKGNKELYSVVINYRGVIDTVRAADVYIDGVSLRVPVETSAPDYTPRGTVTLIIDDSGDKVPESHEFTDGIGPVITHAAIVEKFGTGNAADSLYITFSELIDNPGTSWIYNIYDGASRLSSVPSVTDVENTGENVWLYVLEAPQPVEAGMGLQLISGSPARDTCGNSVHEGVHDTVIIDLIERALPIESAWYIDGNGDGIVDSIFIVFLRPPHNIDDIDVSFVWPEDNRQGTVQGLSYTNGDSSVIAGSIAGGTGIRTGGPMNVSAEFREFSQIAQGAAGDSAGPVLISARYIPGVENSGNGYYPDTLQVVFSEEVTAIDNSTPFLFEGFENGGSYEISMETGNLSGSSYTFIVREISGLDYPVNGDWIWIDPTAGIGDTGGVRQEITDNRKIRMTVVPQPYTVSVKAYPNPFTPGVSNLPVSGSSVQKGVAIEVLPRCKNRVIGEISVSATIYDAVGNIVLSQGQSEGNGKTFELVRDTDYDKIWLLWNGANRNERYVGPGTYAVIMETTIQNGEKETVTLKVGVK